LNVAQGAILVAFLVYVIFDLETFELLGEPFACVGAVGEQRFSLAAFVDKIEEDLGIVDAGRSDFELGYENFKIGAMLKQARLSAGVSQQELARRINSKKSSISRMENHAEDVKLSTLEKYVSALGKKIRIKIA
jgi:HTH-type transcriptional regulator / antitoxin HipB